MSYILNIETATKVCSIAIGKDGKLIALKEADKEKSHSSVITLFIQEVLKEASIALSSLDAVAVSKGPGSYTGLRIGVSTAKGVCYSLDKPLIAISTLQAMALGAAPPGPPVGGGSQHSETPSSPPPTPPKGGESQRSKTHYNPSDKSDAIPKVSPQRGDGRGAAVLFCPMIDARRMEVYTAFYDMNNNEVRKTSADIIDENSYTDILDKNKVVFFGDGAAKCKEVLSHYTSAIFVDNVFPSARNMIPLSEKAFNDRQFGDVAYFEPYYLKDFIAGIPASSGGC